MTLKPNIQEVSMDMYIDNKNIQGYNSLTKYILEDMFKLKS